MIFPIEIVSVYGPLVYTSQETIERTVLAEMKGGFFSVDLNRVHDALVLLPAVENVKIERQWPETLRIFVTERKPIAKWKDEGYVDRSGYLIITQSPSQVSLPLLSGPKGTRALMVQKYLNCVKQLRTLKLKITQVTLVCDGSWYIMLEDGIKLIVGKEDFDARLRSFAASYPAIKNETKQTINSVDLRYTNGIAVGV